MIHAPAPIAAAQAYDFSVLEEYAHNPAPFHAEEAERRAQTKATWDAITEASPWRQRQLARWAAEDAA